MALINVVGHFGTTYSYATIAHRLCTALHHAGILGSVSNLDRTFHPRHEQWATPEHAEGTRPEVDDGRRFCILISAPHHYLSAYAEVYGKERSAIFACPNTSALSLEHANTCRQFGRVIVPSDWCAQAVEEATNDLPVQLPLGVEEWAEDRPFPVPGGSSGGPVKVLHLTTDQWWPGRKGTEELLEAWDILAPPYARLTLHVPPALELNVLQRVREMKDGSTVDIVCGPELGSANDGIRHLMSTHDLMVAPSRCEGWGIMLQTATSFGLPLLCTYNTGHRDHLSGSRGWMGIPDDDRSPLAGEEGSAPTVDPRVLALHLDYALTPAARRMMRESPAVPGCSWPNVMKLWADWAMEWTEEVA